MTQTNFSEECLKTSDLDTDNGFKFNKQTGLWEVDTSDHKKIYPLVQVDNNIEVLGGSVIRNYMIIRNGQGWLHFDFIPARKWWNSGTSAVIFKLPSDAPEIVGLVESNIAMATNLGGVKISQIWTDENYKKGQITLNKFSGTLSNTGKYQYSVYG